jgi:hypothetical protein
MRSTIRNLLWLCLAALLPLCAQTSPAPSAPAEIDIRKVLDEVAAHTKRVTPILDQLEPNNWVTSKGAPAQYVTQWNSSRAQARALIADAQALRQEPDKLPPALQVYFRVQALQSMLASLAEGIRRYQNPALGDLLQGVAAEGSQDRESLQQYIVNLATEKEQMLKIMDHEAQRCRGILSRQPVPSGKTVRK